MRISDWSSDVCSSDLLAVAAIVAVVGIRRLIVGRWARGQLLLGHRDQLLLFFRRVLVLDAKTVALDDARRGLVANQRITLLLALRRSEEHTSELQSLMRISYAVFCLKKKKTTT